MSDKNLGQKFFGLLALLGKILLTSLMFFLSVISLGIFKSKYTEEDEDVEVPLITSENAFEPGWPHPAEIDLPKRAVESDNKNPEGTQLSAGKKAKLPVLNKDEQDRLARIIARSSASQFAEMTVAEEDWPKVLQWINDKKQVLQQYACVHYMVTVEGKGQYMIDVSDDDYIDYMVDMRSKDGRKVKRLDFLNELNNQEDLAEVPETEKSRATP